MEIPLAAKGYLYPSSRISRCPFYHRCLISNKCQSYDAHCHACVTCESMNPYEDKLGGYLPEGEYIPDLQDSIATVEKSMGLAMAHVDHEFQKVDGEDITLQHEKTRKASDQLNQFLSKSMVEIEDEILEELS